MLEQIKRFFSSKRALKAEFHYLLNEICPSNPIANVTVIIRNTGAYICAQAATMIVTGDFLWLRDSNNGHLTNQFHITRQAYCKCVKRKGASFAEGIMLDIVADHVKNLPENAEEAVKKQMFILSSLFNIDKEEAITDLVPLILADNINQQIIYIQNHSRLEVNSTSIELGLQWLKYINNALSIMISEKGREEAEQNLKNIIKNIHWYKLPNF